MIKVGFKETGIKRCETGEKLEKIAEEAILLICERLYEINNYIDPQELSVFPEEINHKLKTMIFK